MDDIIVEILEAREDDGKINVTDKKLTLKENIRRKKSSDLYKFIDRKVHPKIKGSLVDLIEKYIDAYCEQSGYECQLYYKAGFSDAIKIILTAYGLSPK